MATIIINVKNTLIFFELFYIFISKRKNGFIVIYVWFYDSSNFFNMTHFYKFYLVFLSCFLLTITSCKESGEPGKESETAENIPFNNPVLQGDFADPSVVRVGQEYWATATSSEWAPLYPILNSNNLQDWKITGHVFPDGPPEWAEAHFWAPEISYDRDKFYIYYTAKKKDGPLCVGVASSTSANGPYKDHGPIVCQEAGAIDGFPVRDEEGKLFLIWKEDGNSRGEPTPMWGQEMNEERTQLLGEKFELFRNDPSTWEGNLVEGAYIIRKGDYYYTFYSGDACCGRGCTYGVGVARAKQLTGPWEKYENNPIKRENEEWKCAGHGTLVKTEDERYYFLYHAYAKDGTVYTGRQGLLNEVVWQEDGWPKFKAESNDVKALTRAKNDTKIKDDFNADELSQKWQWPVGNSPEYDLGNNALSLKAKPDKLGAVLAHRTLSPDYEAVTTVEVPRNGVQLGLAAIGDQNNALGISVAGNSIVLWQYKDGNEEILAEQEYSGNGSVQLKMEVEDGERYNFSWSKNGENWETFEGTNAVEGAYLPPWDRAVRVGLISKGASGNESVFDDFQVTGR